MNRIIYKGFAVAFVALTLTACAGRKTYERPNVVNENFSVRTISLRIVLAVPMSLGVTSSPMPPSKDISIRRFLTILMYV